MLIGKLDVFESIFVFSEASDLFSDNHLLEINDGMFGFHIFVFDYSFTSTFSSMESPSHMWIFSNDFANGFFFSSVEISIVFFDVILNSFSLKWR